jgi:hypothetical protein
MIRCRRPRKPKVFDRLVGRPGRAWLRANPGSDDLLDLWKLVRPNLARGFKYRCAYTAMLCLDGTVDHFISVKRGSPASVSMVELPVCGPLDQQQQAEC